MNLVSISAKNLLRNKLRTWLTVLGMAVGLVSFVLLRAIVDAYHHNAERAAEDRLVTRHKISPMVGLPLKYMDAVRSIPGIRVASYATAVALIDPGNPSLTFAGWAADPATFLSVFDEAVLPGDQLKRWQEDRGGVVIGEVTARKMGCKVGDRITVISSRYGNMEFTVSGIYQVPGKAAERTNIEFVFHWDFFNPKQPEQMRDNATVVFSRVSDPARGASVGTAIDALFRDKGVSSLTMSERTFGLSLLGGFSAILAAVDIASLILLVVMMLIIGNTITMAVRERTREQATLRALGFRAPQVAAFVVAESATLGLVSGLLGIAISYVFVGLVVGRWLEENVGQLVPYFRVSIPLLMQTLLISTALGVVAGIMPAYRASRLSVVDALRRVA